MSRGANQRPPLLDLPTHFKAMFEPNQPVQYKAPIIKKKMPPLSGVARFLTPDLFEEKLPATSVAFLTPYERKQMIHEQRREQQAAAIEELAVANYTPTDNVKATM